MFVSICLLSEKAGVIHCIGASCLLVRYIQRAVERHPIDTMYFQLRLPSSLFDDQR